MKTFFPAWLVAVVVGALALRASAAPPLTAEQILKFSADKMAGYQTWSANYVQTMQMPGGQMSLQGQITEKSPGRMRMVADMPMMGQTGQMTVVLGDDKIMWQEMTMAGQRRVMKMEMNSFLSNTLAKAGMNVDPAAAMDPSQKWKQTEKYFDFTVESSGTLSNQSSYVLVGNMKESVRTNQQAMAQFGMLGRMRLVIGQTDGFVYKIDQFDKSGTNSVMTMEFRDVKFNEPVPDAAFVYHPPAGVQVIDIGQMMQQMGAGAGQQPAPEASTPAPPPAATH